MNMSSLDNDSLANCEHGAAVTRVVVHGLLQWSPRSFLFCRLLVLRLRAPHLFFLFFFLVERLSSVSNVQLIH